MLICIMTITKKKCNVSDHLQQDTMLDPDSPKATVLDKQKVF